MARTSKPKPRAPTFKATALRRDLYRVLDRVAETGQPAFIERKGKLLKIAAAAPPGDVDALPERPDLIVGDPDALVHMDWSAEWRP